MSSTLQTRVTTAVLFAGVVIGGIYAHQYTYLALLGLIGSMCLLEFLDLVLNKAQGANRIRKVFGIVLGLSLFGLAICSVMCPREGNLLYKYLLGGWIPLLFLILLFELFNVSPHPFQNFAWLVAGIFYCIVPFSLLVLVSVKSNTYLPNIVMGLLVLVWVNDSFAYLGGSRIGKTPLFPRISPKKTWEGSVCGVIGTLLFAFGLSYLFLELSAINWMVLGLITVVFGSLGDLVESMLKRSLKIKDSGNLLPGHGGMLDRFDAFLFLLPFACGYLMWVM